MRKSLKFFVNTGVAVTTLASTSSIVSSAMKDADNILVTQGGENDNINQGNGNMNPENSNRSCIKSFFYYTFCCCCCKKRPQHGGVLAVKDEKKDLNTENNNITEQTKEVIEEYSKNLCDSIKNDRSFPDYAIAVADKESNFTQAVTSLKEKLEEAKKNADSAKFDYNIVSRTSSRYCLFSENDK